MIRSLFGLAMTCCLAVLVSISPLRAQAQENKAETGGARDGSERFEKVAEGMNFPEGPAWDGKGAVYVSNCFGGWITKIGAEGVGVFLRASDDPFTFEKTNGMTFFRDGSLFACEFGRGAILRFQPDGKSEIYASGYRGEPFQWPNDLAFDPKGNLYFSDPDAKTKPGEPPEGALYRIAADSREVTQLATGLSFPNGLAFSSDARHLYVCESRFHRILKYALKDDGALGEREVFAELPGGEPDGIGFDREGNLYAAHFGGRAIVVLAPDGSIKEKIPTPGANPSNVEFAGDDLRTLYITEDETNAVYRTRVEIPGQRLFSSPQ